MAIYTFQGDDEQKRLLNPRLQRKRLGSSTSPSLFKPPVHRIDANKKFRSLQVGHRRVRPTDTLTNSMRPNLAYPHKRRRLTPRAPRRDLEPVSPIRLVRPPDDASSLADQIDESLRNAQSILSHNRIIGISSPIRETRKKPVHELESPIFQNGPITIDIPDSINEKKGEKTGQVKESALVDQKMQIKEEVVEMKVLRLFLKNGSNTFRTSKPLTLSCSSKGVVIRNEQDTSFINIPPNQVEIAYISEHRADFRICMILVLKETLKGKLRTSEVTFNSARIHLDPCSRDKYDRFVHHLKGYGAKVKVTTFSDHGGLTPTSIKTFYGSERKTRGKVKDPNFVSLSKYDSSMHLRNRSHRNIDYHKAHKMEIRLDLDDYDQHVEDLSDKQTNVLSPDVAEIVTEAIPYRDQIVFRPPLHYKIAPKKSLIVTNNDFTCLYNSNWINDSIVDFFLNFDYKKAKEAGHLADKQVEIFNSFFFSQLANPVSPVENCYENVRSWFKASDDLFDHDYVIIPIMSELHWYSVIIYNLPGVKKLGMAKKRTSMSPKKNNSQLKKDPNSTSENVNEPQDISKDDLLAGSSETKESGVSPSKEKGLNIPKEKGLIRKRRRYSECGHIYILDSLRKMHVSISPLLKNFLIAYAKDKYDIDLDTSDFVRHNAPIPRQKNFNDCGLHVIYNLNVFFQNPTNFQEKVLTKTGRVSRELFRPEERKKMRPTLRNALIELLKKQVDASGGDSSKIGTETNETVAKEKILMGEKVGPDGHKAAPSHDEKSDSEDDDLIIIESKSIESADDESAKRSSFPITLRYHSKEPSLDATQKSKEPSHDDSKKFESGMLENALSTASKADSLLEGRKIDVEKSSLVASEKKHHEDKALISTEKFVERDALKAQHDEKIRPKQKSVDSSNSNQMSLEKKVSEPVSVIKRSLKDEEKASSEENSVRKIVKRNGPKILPKEPVTEEFLLGTETRKRTKQYSRSMVRISSSPLKDRNMIIHSSDDLIKKEIPPVMINLDLEPEHEKDGDRAHKMKTEKVKTLDAKPLKRKRGRPRKNAIKIQNMAVEDRGIKVKEPAVAVNTILDGVKEPETQVSQSHFEEDTREDTPKEESKGLKKGNISTRVGRRQDIQIWKEISIISDRSAKDSEIEAQESDQFVSQSETSRETSSTSGIASEVVSEDMDVKTNKADEILESKKADGNDAIEGKKNGMNIGAGRNYDDGDGDQEWTETSKPKLSSKKRGRKRKQYTLAFGIESIGARLGRRRRNMKRVGMSEPSKVEGEKLQISVTPVKLVEDKPVVNPPSPSKGRQRRRQVKMEVEDKTEQEPKVAAGPIDRDHHDDDDDVVSFKNPLKRPKSISFLGASKRGSKKKQRRRPGTKGRGRRAKKVTLI